MNLQTTPTTCAMYGLKQAPRQWYKKFDSFMHKIGFKRCEAYHCCYVKFFDNSYIILLLYVGDMLIVGSGIEEINNMKKQLSKQFAMKDLEVGKEMIWLHGFLDELDKKQKMGILHSDSQSAIFLAKNSAFHSKSKHIQTKYHFIRYLVEDKLVILEKICGSKNPIDMLTKGVTIEKLKLCAASIGLLA